MTISEALFKMSEQKFKNEIKGYLEFLGLHVQRHEDKYETGVADLSYAGRMINGWIETKWIFPHFRKRQPLWLSKRAILGGHTFVLVGKIDGCRLIDWRTLAYRDFEGDVNQYAAALADRLCLAEYLGIETVPLDQRPPGFHQQLEKYLRPE